MKTIPTVLVLTGALPFLSASLSLVAGGPFHQTTSVVILITYGAVILSFLGGIQWGLALKMMDTAPKSATRLFALSVLPSLLAWGVLMFMINPHMQLIALLGILVGVWAVDGLLAVQQLIPAWFFKLRSLITAIVGLCFIVSWWALPR